MDMMMDEALGCFDPRPPRPDRPPAWGGTRCAIAAALARSTSPCHSSGDIKKHSVIKHLIVFPHGPSSFGPTGREQRGHDLSDLSGQYQSWNAHLEDDGRVVPEIERL